MIVLATARVAWPHGPLDLAALALLLVVALALPAAGYLAMAQDLRRWRRSLRRALVHVTFYLREVPPWARTQTPRSIAALGLRMPCTPHDLKEAYRRKVVRLHPDRGGDKRHFLWLQAQFEEALNLLESKN